MDCCFISFDLSHLRLAHQIIPVHIISIIWYFIFVLIRKLEGKAESILLYCHYNIIYIVLKHFEWKIYINVTSETKLKLKNKNKEWKIRIL